MTAVGGFLLRHWRCFLWGFALAVWTWALTSHKPVEVNQELISDSSLQFTASKALHLGMYAALTATSGLLGARGWYRFLFPIGMVLHGALTEFIQYSFPQLHRHG
jgi:hypothetical protein